MYQAQSECWLMIQEHRYTYTPFGEMLTNSAPGVYMLLYPLTLKIKFIF
jgi:hypothetical protein